LFDDSRDNLQIILRDARAGAAGRGAELGLAGVWQQQQTAK
jgi:hypothetical protein